MKPVGLHSKIYLDSGDPKETEEALELLGFLDGQTTNPSLIAKNPAVQERIAHGQKFTQQEILEMYKSIIQEIADIMPDRSISIEVYADTTTSTETMLAQAREMFSWTPKAQIKFPILASGIAAAEQAIAENLRVNMTLCFSQEQGAAAYSATKGAQKGAVYLSPFIGRFDDRGMNGMDIVAHSLKMLAKGDGHVEVVASSVRTLDHFLASIQLGADIVTTPLKVLREWVEHGMILPDSTWQYPVKDLSPIEYGQVELGKPWKSYDLNHPITAEGIERFVKDWNALIT